VPWVLSHSSFHILLFSIDRVVSSLKDYGAKVASVVCGKKHTLVLTVDGEVLSCGVGEYGRLGTGSTSDCSSFASVEALAEEDIVQIEAGASHSLALTAEGVVYSWGRNDRGQLGMRDSNMDIYSTESYPRIIEDTANCAAEHRVVQVAAGEDRSAYVTADGRLYVWGARLTHYPQLVDTSLFNGLRVRKCVIGGHSSESMFAILTEDGALWTFGDRSCPMLGQGSASRINLTKQSTPHHVPALEGKKVLDVYAGQGMHIAARVVAPEVN
jgi:alpha-tubulin suppressor-like RCC1 family protein